MKNLLHLIGMDDGNGNTSSMRVWILLILLALLIPKVVIAIKTSTPVTFSQEDMEVLGILLSAKIVQNHQESKTLEIKTP